MIKIDWNEPLISNKKSQRGSDIKKKNKKLLFPSPKLEANCKRVFKLYLAKKKIYKNKGSVARINSDGTITKVKIASINLKFDNEGKEHSFTH